MQRVLHSYLPLLALAFLALLALGLPGTPAMEQQRESQARPGQPGPSGSGLPGILVPRTTPRTPIEQLPFTITECGSYFLTGCLTGMTALDGITVMADDVTIDLNGFSLIGVPGSLSGIAVQPGVQGFTAFGGSLRNWGISGLAAGPSTSGSLRDLHSGGSGAAGFMLEDNWILQDCVGTGNTGHGLQANSHCIIRGSIFNANQGNGILTGLSCLVEGTVANGNTLNGIEIGQGSQVTRSLANTNSQTGILGSRLLVRGNVAIANTTANINATLSTVVENQAP